MNFRSIAKKHATEEAAKVAKRVANEYMQSEAADIIKANVQLAHYGPAVDSSAEEAASG